MTDWETDIRPYDQVLRAWRDAHGWSWQQVAAVMQTLCQHCSANWWIDGREKMPASMARDAFKEASK